MSYRYDATNKEALQYSIGNVASNIFFLFIGSFLMLFYTDVMGITPIIGGTIFMTARLVDAFTDPLMGMIADRTNSKWGRYRPYVNIGAPIFSALFVGMFIVPDVSMAGKIVYSYTVYILFSLGRTVVQIAYMSLTALVSPDPVKRGRWAAYKQVIGMGGALIGMTLGLPLLNTFGGIGNESAWISTAVVFAILTTLIYWFSMRGARKMDPPRKITDKTKDTAVITEGDDRKFNLKKQIKYVFGNVPLIMLLIAFSTDSFANQITNAVNINFFRYYLQKTNLFTTISLVGMVIMLVVGLFIVPVLLKKFSKKSLILFGEAAAIVPLAIVYFMPKASVMPIVSLTLFAQMFMTISMITFWAAVPDCSDYAEWRYGGEAAGAVASTITFMNKLAQALGAFVSGAILTATGYVAKAATQNPQVLQGLLSAKTLIPIGGFICSLIAMSFYSLNKEKLDIITSELKERRNTQKESYDDLQRQF